MRLTLLHLGDQLFVEQASCLLVQWAIDCDNVALTQHLLKILNSSAANLLFDLWLQWLVVEVEQLFAVKWLQSSEYALSDTANSHCSDYLVLKIILILGHSSHVPVSTLDLLVGGDEVSDEQEDGHNDVLGDRDDVGSGDLGNCNSTIGSVGSIQINVVGADTSGDSDLQFLGLCEAFSSQITGMEAGRSVCFWCRTGLDLRSGDDDFGIDQLLVKLRVLALLVGGRDKSVSLILKPFSDT